MQTLGTFNAMTIYIRNMVCNRCIAAVKQAFEIEGFKPKEVKLGEVTIPKALTKSQLSKMGSRMLELGFEILDDQKKRIIEKVKNLLIEKVQTGALEEHFRISDYLGRKLNKDYSSISRLFSEVEGLTIEQFLILQKIEKVKEWIAYDELNLSEIAWKLGYSSVAHLSAQFKKVTGLTPSHFKKAGGSQRRSIDLI